VTPDIDPSIDPSQPVELWLGRGSGSDGLDVIHIEPDGTVVVDRRQRKRQGKSTVIVRQRASLTLSAERLGELSNSLFELGIDDLQDRYVDRSVHDGSQWILRFQQGPRERLFYFSNRFPAPVKDFAKALDLLLSRAGLSDNDFRVVEGEQETAAQEELWDAYYRDEGVLRPDRD
jgi:hypothetical protein